MAYDVTKLTKLSALKELAEKVKSDYATKTSVSNLETRINEIVATGGEPNTINKISVNGTEQAITNKAVDITVPTKVSDLINDSNYQTEDQINAKISSVYKPGGSVTFANLPTASKDVLGNVYNVTDAFTTTDDFVEGAGSKYPKGTNVVVITVEDAYKYDVLAGFVDLTNYVTKETGKGLSTNDYTTEEKTKLAGLSNYSHPTHDAKENGFYKVTIDDLGHVSATVAVAKSDITALGIPASDTTYDLVTSTENGLMSAADKGKLDGILIASDAEVTEMLTEVFTVA